MRGATLPFLFSHVLGFDSFRETLPNSLLIHHTQALGHVNGNGGGNLNEFGTDFKRFGFTWNRELCETDSDGDGLTNGEELGDPCCAWPGRPARDYSLSHPGNAKSVVGKIVVNCSDAATSGASPPQETDDFWRFYYEQNNHEQNLKSSDVIAMENMFLEQAKLGYACQGPAVNVIPACGGNLTAEACGVCVRQNKCTPTELSGSWQAVGCSAAEFTEDCTLISRCMPRDGITEIMSACYQLGAENGYRTIQGRTTCKTKRGEDICLATHLSENDRVRWDALAKGVQTRGWLSRQFLAWFGARDSVGLAMAVFVLVTTIGILVCDRDTLLEIGRRFTRRGERMKYWLLLVATVAYIDLCSGLVHLTLDNPLITHWPLIGGAAENFQGHHVHPSDITKAPWLGHLTEMFFVNGSIRIVVLLFCFSPDLRLFLIFIDALTMLMMAAHRWAHTVPSHTPGIVRALMSCGLLISHQHHSYHHAAFSSNFCIFTGWWDPVFNCLSTYVPGFGIHSRIWPLLLFVFTFVLVFYAMYRTNQGRPNPYAKLQAHIRSCLVSSGPGRTLLTKLPSWSRLGRQHRGVHNL